MADKLTLLELHLHSDENEFTSDFQLSSDIGELLRNRLGLGSEDSESDEFSTDTDEGTSFDTDTDDETSSESDSDEETSSESEPDAGVDPLGADGGSGGAVQTTDDEASDTVVEIDEDVGDEEGESSGSALRKLFVLGLLVGLALVAQWYLGGDDLEDEFAMDDDEFGDDEDEFEEL
jgi:cytoskeletal protein RodZ